MELHRHDGTKVEPAAPVTDPNEGWQKTHWEEPLSSNESLKESQTPNEPGLPSVPAGAEFEPNAAAGPAGDANARYTVAPDQPTEGINGKLLVKDTRNGGRLMLFKPENQQKLIPRAGARGIRPGESAPRAKAAHDVAVDLGLATPDVRLVTINGQRGSLTEWVPEGQTLKDIAKADPRKAADVMASPEYQKLRADIDAFDFLINSLDRNGGNLIVQFGPDGRVTGLIPIDHDAAFTSTPERAVIRPFANDMPDRIDPSVYENLVRMGANREQLANALGPLIGREAVPGVMQRLDMMLHRFAPAPSH